MWAAEGTGTALQLSRALQPSSPVCHIQRDSSFHPANGVFNLKTAVTGSSLLPPLPSSINLFFIHCSPFSQATPYKCQCVPTGAEYVVLFHSKLTPLSIGSYIPKQKNNAHAYAHATLVKPLRQIK